MSFSEAGLFGLYARTARNFVDPPPPSGPYVPGAPEFCKYFFLNDSMGNVRATVDPSGNVQYQVYDAFGNEMGGGTLMRCNPTSQRMLAGGRAQWRGAEGSQTDINNIIIDEIVPPVAFGDNWPTSHESYSRKTSGLVFMQNRFYEPATGRFTQADPMALGFETFLQGQNNRWVYCANDPVNCSDPTGLIAPAAIAFLALAILALLALWFVLGSFKTAGSCWYNPNTWKSWTDMFHGLAGLLGFGLLAGLVLVLAWPVLGPLLAKAVEGLAVDWLKVVIGGAVAGAVYSFAKWLGLVYIHKEEFDYELRHQEIKLREKLAIPVLEGLLMEC